MIKMRNLVLLAASLTVLALPMIARSEDRGRMLYENHCVACHESSVHIREARKVKSYADLERYANRFAKLAGVEWSDAEKILVIEYLNRTHYKLKH